jgi:hypothetical protein
MSSQIKRWQTAGTGCLHQSAGIRNDGGYLGRWHRERDSNPAELFWHGCQDFLPPRMALVTIWPQNDASTSHHPMLARTKPTLLALSTTVNPR